MEYDCYKDNLPPEQRQEVECELDVLNQTAPQINDLENKLLAARLNYQETLSENSNKLKALGNRLGKCVQRSRAYYELCEAQADRLSQIQRATKRYTHANATLSAAREELAKLEATIGGCKDTGALENMNQAILRINATKQEVTESFRVHQELLQEYNTAEQTLRRIERRNKSDINKSRPYFETKQQFDRNMQEAKMQVDLFAEKVTLCKSIYADAMSRLEQISASVHDTRRRQTMTSNPSSSPPSSVRGQGVGAESVESIAELTCSDFDVFSAAPRSNEKSISATDSPLNRLKFSLPASDSSKQRPFVNGLLQHVHDATVQLAVCDHSIRLNSADYRTAEQTPHPIPASISTSFQAQTEPSSNSPMHSTNADSYPSSTNCQSYRDLHHPMNASFGVILDYLPTNSTDLSQTVWSDSYSTLYMKRAHSSSALPTSCSDV